MDEEQTKSCPNCKRDIPSVNYTIHTVHCARNIRVCPVCKEPVPLSDLQRHHDEFHKQLPCKQCGEKVCGTDLEDHLRDSCANTVKSCRYCELELARRELPAHEGYCGVRTEQCSECREWVMIKYRQLHLDSNHGFLRLHDDPAPIPRKEVTKSNINRPFAIQASTSDGNPRSIFNNGIRNTDSTALSKGLNNTDATRKINAGTSTDKTGSKTSNDEPSTSSQLFGTKVPVKRTNDQPQININVGPVEKVTKDLPSSRGAVKKRPAPKPPVREPPANPHRDLPYYSALERYQKEEKRRNEQNAYNLSVGLPPVLNPAQKVEKLRKMDALQNRELLDNDYKNRLQGRVWAPASQDVGKVLGNHKQNRDTQTTNPGPSRSNLNCGGTSANARSFQNMKNLASTSKPSNINLKNEISTAIDDEEIERRREEFKNFKPMTPEEFMVRFNELQLRKDGEENKKNERSGDRFSEIKSSLRELRRGLNEVTAPYNINSGTTVNNLNNEVTRLSPSIAMDMSEDEDIDEEVELLPCEFCGAPVPMDDLVQHQTGCRPDLAQYRGRKSPPGSPEANARGRGDAPVEDPVIPCEFCAESLPVYLITEHQKHCGRDENHTFIYYPE